MKSRVSYALHRLQPSNPLNLKHPRFPAETPQQYAAPGQVIRHSATVFLFEPTEIKVRNARQGTTTPQRLRNGSLLLDSFP